MQRTVALPGAVAVIAVGLLVPAAPAHASVELCLKPVVTCAQTLADQVVAVAKDPGTGTNIGPFVDALLTDVTTISDQCLNDASSACYNLKQATITYINSAVDLAKQCADGTEATCNTTENLAKQLARGAVTLALQCASGQYQTCNDAEALAASLEEAIVQFATTCAQGINSTCSTATNAAFGAVAEALDIVSTAETMAQNLSGQAPATVAQIEQQALSLEQEAVSTAQQALHGVPDPSSLIAAVGNLVSADSGGVSLVPSTDPADYVVTPEDVLAEEQKTAQVAQDQANLTRQLTNGLLLPVPQQDQVATQPPGGGDDAPPAAAKVHHTGYGQANTEWCLPVSVQVTLSAFSYYPNIQSIADALGQHDSQAQAHSFAPAQRYLNNELPSFQNHYVLSEPSAPDVMLGYVESDIYHRAAPVITGDWTGALPWWQGQLTYTGSSGGGHALANIGYYTQGGGGFYVWDSAYGSHETLALKDGYAAYHTMKSKAQYKVFLW